MNVASELTSGRNKQESGNQTYQLDNHNGRKALYRHHELTRVGIFG
jgi:hypothetical protein